MTRRGPQTAGFLHPGQSRRRAAAVNQPTRSHHQPGLTAVSTGTSFTAEEPAPTTGTTTPLHRNLDNLPGGGDAPGGQHRLGASTGVHLEHRGVQEQVIQLEIVQTPRRPSLELLPDGLAHP